MAGWDRFWHQERLSPARLRVLRVGLYALVALDCWLWLPRAAQYGADGFNVSHLPALDAWLPLPSPGLIAGSWLIQCVLAAWIALGVAGRGAGALLAGLFGATYLSSQLDTYQHHYLVFLLLLVLAFQDWRREDAPQWPVRLALVEVAIVYVWTAVAKVDALWLDGTLPSMFIQGRGPDIAQGLGLIVGVGVSTVWSAIGAGVIALELLLAAAVLLPRLRPVAFPAALAFHASFSALGFEIGRFPAYMIALWLVMLPEGWSAAVRARLPALPEPRVPRAALLCAPFALLALAWRFTPIVGEYHAVGALVSWRQGDAAGARAGLHALLALEPGRAAGWVNLADLHAETGDFNAALTSLARLDGFEREPALAARRDIAIRALSGEPVTAVAWYNAACGAGDARACEAPMYLVPEADLLGDRLARACEAGRSGACMELGARLRDGLDVQQDLEGALLAWRLGCDQEHARSCGLLGDALASGADPLERRRGVRALDKACALGEIPACRRVGALHLLGEAAGREPTRAHAAFSAGCHAGDLIACGHLAWTYAEGVGATRSTARARRYALEACEAGVDLGCDVLTSLATPDERP